MIRSGFEIAFFYYFVLPILRNITIPLVVMEQRKYTAEQVVQRILDDDESDLSSSIDDQENNDSNEFQDAILSIPNSIVDSEDAFVADFVEELHQFVSRNGEVWSKAPTMCNVHCACAHNIVHDQHGPSCYLLNTYGASAFEAFKIF